MPEYLDRRLQAGSMKILITNHFLEGFSGSEILTLDIAIAFKRLNYNVTVGTFTYRNPLKIEFEKHSINVIDLNTIEEKDFFDIIWCHHFTTIDLCLLEKHITASKIIYSSLSPFESLEAPPLSVQEVNLFLANSLENKNKLMEMGVSVKDIIIFPNPVPENFHFFPKRSRTELKRIAVVSNHVPKEITDSKSIFNKNNIDIDFFGLGHDYILITPNILYKFDAVITIGRTAQYCLSMGIPLYCYDSFGGPGWITKDNIKLSSEFNFSGRCTGTKKSPEQIFSEMTHFFTRILKNIEFYKEFSQQQHILADSLTNIVHSLERKSKVSIKNDRLIKNIITRQHKFYDTQFTSQLFIDFGNGFSEENSLSIKISPKQTLVSFILPNQDKNIIHKVRFDPLNTSCYLKINRIGTIDKNNNSHEINMQLQTNASFQKKQYFLFDTNDPQLLITPDTPDYFNDKTILFFDFAVLLINNQEKTTHPPYQKQETNVQNSTYRQLSKELNYIYKMIRNSQHNEIKNNIIRAEVQLELLKNILHEKV